MKPFMLRPSVFALLSQDLKEWRRFGGVMALQLLSATFTEGCGMLCVYVCVWESVYLSQFELSKTIKERELFWAEGVNLSDMNS